MVTSEYIPIKRETVKAFADEARRIAGVEGEVTTDEMLAIFGSAQGGIPENARLYYVGNANSTFMCDGLFKSSAVGTLSE